MSEDYFERISPQKVRHSSGCIVQFAGRYNLEYISPRGSSVIIEVDDSSCMAVFKDSIKCIEDTNGNRPITPEEKDEILSFIAGALPVMGVTFEII